MVRLLDKMNPSEKREWYRQAIIENGWSQIMLDHQIDLQLYERQQLAGKVANFFRTLPASESEFVLPTLCRAAIKDAATCLEVV